MTTSSFSFAPTQEVGIVSGSFGRLIDLYFTNRAGQVTNVAQDGTVTSVANINTKISGLRIEFEFDKQLDHSDSSDSGSITIYG